jgi:hypothetical protein
MTWQAMTDALREALAKRGRVWGERNAEQRRLALLSSHRFSHYLMERGLREYGISGQYQVHRSPEATQASSG